MKFLFFLFTIIGLNVFANENLEIQTKAILRTQKKISIEEGSSFEAKLIISPVTSNELDFFKKNLTDGFLTDHFWIKEIKSINYSSNNMEAIEASLVVIAAKELKIKDLTWSLAKKKIPLLVDSVEIIKIELKSKEPIFMESYKQKKNYKYYLLVPFLLFIGWLLFRSKFKKKESLSFKEKVLLLAKEASSREDFEIIFRKGKKAERIEKQKIISGTKFETVLNKYQYKKKWSTAELEEVKRALSETLC